MIYVITWSRMVVIQHHHLETVKAKFDIMAHDIKVFIEMFDPLVKMGLHYYGRKMAACGDKKNTTTC